MDRTTSVEHCGLPQRQGQSSSKTSASSQPTNSSSALSHSSSIQAMPVSLPATTPASGTYAEISDLPPEMIAMIIEYLPDGRSRALFRFAFRSKSVIPQSHLVTTWQLIPALQAVKQLWDLAFLHNRLINDAPVRENNPSWVEKVALEDVWPTPPSQFGISLEETVDELPCYTHYLDRCNVERMSPVLGRLFAAAVGRLNSLETLEYSPGFHHTRHPMATPTAAQRLEFAWNLEERHDWNTPLAYAMDMWNEGRFLMYEGVICDYTGPKMFNEAIDEALRNPFSINPLRVIIKTRQKDALWPTDANATPIPSGQLAHVLDITYLKYVGYMIGTPRVMSKNFEILSNQQQVAGAHYAALKHLTIRGDGLGDDRALDITELGSPDCTPDWSSLVKLSFVDVQFNTVAAAYMAQSKCHLNFKNVFWQGDSFMAYSNGSSLRRVTVSGLFVLENFNDVGDLGSVQASNFVWIIATTESEADKVAAENAQHCVRLPAFIYIVRVAGRRTKVHACGRSTAIQTRVDMGH